MHKDPQATLDYAVDWAAPVSRENPNGPWLADDETITASTWTVTPDGLTIEDEDSDATTATIWLSGGEIGDPKYTLTNHITTSQGRQDERSFTLAIRNR